jgi:hypothetical protein
MRKIDGFSFYHLSSLTKYYEFKDEISEVAQAIALLTNKRETNNKAKGSGDTDPLL